MGKWEKRKKLYFTPTNQYMARSEVSASEMLWKRKWKRIEKKMLEYSQNCIWNNNELIIVNFKEKKNF